MEAESLQPRALKLRGEARQNHILLSQKDFISPSSHTPIKRSHVDSNHSAFS